MALVGELLLRSAIIPRSAKRFGEFHQPYVCSAPHNCAVICTA